MYTLGLRQSLFKVTVRGKESAFELDLFFLMGGSETILCGNIEYCTEVTGM